MYGLGAKVAIYMYGRILSSAAKFQNSAAYSSDSHVTIYDYYLWSHSLFCRKSQNFAVLLAIGLMAPETGLLFMAAILPSPFS